MLFAPIPVYIADVQTNVQTTVNGSSNVHTKIEVETNGEKKILESDKPGTYKLEVKSDGTTTTTSSNSELQSTASSSPNPSPAPATSTSSVNITVGQKSSIETFFDNCKNFFQQLFSL